MRVVLYNKKILKNTLNLAISMLINVSEDGRMLIVRVLEEKFLKFMS